MPWSASAQTADREQPINYSADTGDVNYQTKVGALSGNVIITQGTLTIRADKIVFRQNADNSMSATATGNPVSFRQKRDGHDEYYEGFAQRAEYDGAKQLLELFDRALLKRGQDEIRSNYISYNSATEVFKAEGRAGASAPDAAPAAADARVRGVFQPKSESPLPGRPKDAAAGAKAPEPPPAGPSPPSAEGDVKAAKAASTPSKASPPSPPLKPASELAAPAR
jgi:lipopolysaccharide export system protein LptA